MGPASPGYVYLPGVPSEFNREQEVRAYLLSEIPGVRRLGLANSQNGNATLAPAAAAAAATPGLHRITYSDIHSSLLRTTLSFCRGDEKNGCEVDRKDEIRRSNICKRTNSPLRVARCTTTILSRVNYGLKMLFNHRNEY